MSVNINDQNMGSALIDSSSQKESLSAKTFAAKFRSKKEVWNFLTIDCGAYLPPMENITIYHMKDLVSGKKKVRNLI